MQFSVAKAQLDRELSLLQNVVERKTTIPMLSNVLIEAAPFQPLTITATDLDVSLQTSCNAEVARPGAVVLPAKKLYDIIHNFPNDTVSFNVRDDLKTEVNCQNSNYKLVGQAREYYPSIQIKPENPIVAQTIPAAAMQALIRQTFYAISQEESRYAINGSLFLIKQDSVEMISTDGHRLSRSWAPLENSENRTASDTIIPRKALQELLKLVGEKGATDVRISIDENLLFFQVGVRLMTARKLAGNFPNYTQVIPKNCDRSITILKDPLIAAIRRASLMSDVQNHGVKFNLESSELLTITAQSADVGQAKEVLTGSAIKEATGMKDPLEIGFNAIYLLDFLDKETNDEVKMQFKGAESPALVSSASNNEYVLMPMRLI